MAEKPDYSNGDNPSIQIPKGHKKITLVGDMGCGKSTLILAFIEARKRDIEVEAQRAAAQLAAIATPEVNPSQPSTSSDQPQQELVVAVAEDQPSSPDDPSHPEVNPSQPSTSSDQPNQEPVDVVAEEQPSSPDDPSQSSGSDEETLPAGPTPFFHASEYITSVEVKRPTEEKVETVVIPLKICDVPGNPAHKSTRPPTYQRSNVVLICFAIDDPASFSSVEQRWIHEIRHFLMNIPIVLVGMKKDLRTDEETIRRLSEQNLQPVSYQQGLDLKERHFFARYVECSTLKDNAVRQVFQIAILGMEEKEADPMQIV